MNIEKNNIKVFKKICADDDIKINNSQELEYHLNKWIELNLMD